MSALRQALATGPARGEMHGGGPYRLRTAEKVRRDLRNALASIPFAIPDDDEASQMARSLMEKTLDPRS